MTLVQQSLPPKYIKWFSSLPKAKRDRFLADLMVRVMKPVVLTEYEQWQQDLFPLTFQKPNAVFHTEFWEWVWSITKNSRPRPWVGIWPRDTGKTTTNEVAAIRLGAEEIRSYFWYVQATQDQADKRTETIASKLESPQVAARYPKMADRMIGKFGQSRGWRRQFVRTASGVVFEAVGLDKAVRSSKVGDSRPDCIIIDDIDERYDSVKTIKKKIDTLTQTILPAGSGDAAVMFVQNLIHPNSIASKLVDGEVDFLADRIVSGPYPAIQDLTTDKMWDEELDRFLTLITGGTPIWAGQGIKACQDKINKDGITSFLRESQHNIEDEAGGLFDHLEYRRCNPADVPDLVRTVVWVDPAVTSTDDSDSMGINAAGIDAKDTIYILYFWEDITSPEDALLRAITKAVELDAESVGVETDQGGDTWESVYLRAWDKYAKENDLVLVDEKLELFVRPEQLGADGDPVPGAKFISRPNFQSAKAGSGHGSKVHRASQMVPDYDNGSIVHVRGTHLTGERALNRFPRVKPYDLVDSLYWSWNDLKDGYAGSGLRSI